MRRYISFSCIILTLFLLSDCASSLKTPIQRYFIPGKTSFEKANSLINIDPKSALEYYSEAKVKLQNFIEDAKGISEASAQVQKANYYIKKIHFGIDFINAREKYSNMDIEEICRKISGNLSLIPQYREEYNDILTTVRKFELYEYLEIESQRLIKKAERDLSRLEKCAKSDTFKEKYLQNYQNGREYFSIGQKYYAKWRQTKKTSYGNSAVEAFINAINEFRNIKAEYIPQAYYEAQTKIQEAQRKIREINILAPQNQRPFARAGSNQQGKVNTRVILNGSASYDPDGDHLTFMWTQVAGPPVTLSYYNTKNPSFTPQAEGNYVFRLVVNDGKLKSSADDVIITIKDIVSYNDLGVFTHDGRTGDLLIVTNHTPDEWIGKTKIIQQSTISRGDYRLFSLYVERYSDLEVCITPGYSLEGGGLSFGGQKVFEGDKTRFKRFIKLKIPRGTKIEIKIRRGQNSPDDFRFIFKLYPR